MHQSVLFSVVTSEPLEVDNQDRRYVVYLNLFHSLFVGNTSVTIPSICLRKVLRLVELSEAVLNAHVLRPVLHLVFTLIVGVFILDEAVQTAVEGPASFGVELNCDFEFVTDG